MAHREPPQCSNPKRITDNQQPTTDNRQPTTDYQQPTTNNQHPTPNTQHPTTDHSTEPPVLCAQAGVGGRRGGGGALGGPSARRRLLLLRARARARARALWQFFPFCRARLVSFGTDIVMRHVIVARVPRASARLLLVNVDSVGRGARGSEPRRAVPSRARCVLCCVLCCVVVLFPSSACSTDHHSCDDRSIDRR